MDHDLDVALRILGLELSSNGSVNHISYRMPKRPLKLESARWNIREIDALVKVLESEGSAMVPHYKRMSEAWVLVVSAMTTPNEC